MNKIISTSHPKFKRMMALFTKTGKQGFRHSYIWRVSGGRTESSKQLYEREIDVLIAELQEDFKSSDRADVMRKKLISMAREIGYEIQHPLNTGQRIADMERINNWCISHGKFNKKLNQHNWEELQMLISQFHAYYLKYLNSL